MLVNNIKELRKQKHLTQKDLAKLMHVSQQTIGAWETERAIPGSDTLALLANLFNVSTDYLLGRDTKEDDLKTADLADDDTIFTFEGKPIPEQDLEYMKRLLRGGRK